MKKKFMVLVLGCVFLLALSACGGGSKGNTFTAGDGWNNKAESSGSVSDSDMPESNMNQSVFEGTDTKMIYTADINMETTEFDSTVNSLRQLVQDMNGYFEESSVGNHSSYRYGNYTVRVPSEKYFDFYSQASAICHVTYSSERAENISETYYDTKARLTTQETKLVRLQELLAQAENMEDIITIEKAISETELEIEQLSGTLRHYDLLVGYSTVNITLNEVYRLSNVEEPAIGFGAKLLASLKSGGINFVEGLQAILLALAYSLPTLLLLAAIAAVITVFCIRHSRKKKNRTGIPQHKNSDDTSKKA